MADKEHAPARMRWARLRFSIVGPLLAAPPEPGELGIKLRELASRSYRHPSTGQPETFSVSTLERWYYAARDADDPIAALARKVPRHAGTHPKITVGMARAIVAQYAQHPRWTWQLHHDNLATLARQDPVLGSLPSYATLRRYMKAQGLLRQRRPRRRRGDEQAPAMAPREVRSYEVSHVHALWHLDFHEGSRKVLCASGEWKTPVLLGVLDDHSRLCCHLQWYLEETAEALAHGLSQAIAKRGLFRALLTDNGSAMQAAEVTEGIERLGALHHLTLPYSPEQNAKQENFWARVEGRLMAMLEGEPELTLTLLNDATQAWSEQEYQREVHSEIGTTPLERALRDPSVGRPSPSSEELRRAFRTEVTRTQRRSDGTITVEGVRFEVPARYRTLSRLSVRVARWDLSSVDLVDPRTGAHLCVLLPLDKQKNADRRRRALVAPDPLVALAPAMPPAGIAPRLRELMAEYAATGLPPAYLPKDSTQPTPEPDGGDEEDDE